MALVQYFSRTLELVSDVEPIEQELVKIQWCVLEINLNLSEIIKIINYEVIFFAIYMISKYCVFRTFNWVGTNGDTAPVLLFLGTNSHNMQIKIHDFNK